MSIIEKDLPSEYNLEAWKKREKHDKIMKVLGRMYGYARSSGCDYGHCERWAIGNEPSLDFLREVMERGREDEIIFMINKYGRSMPAPNTRVYGCTGCGRGYFHTPVYMPAEIQVLIAKRGIRKEMETLASYYGFSGPGQDVILERGNHDEIMWYLGLHGFLHEQQKKLIERGNQEEIDLHLMKHGMSDELLGELFNNMKKGEGLDTYYKCIQGPDFSISSQKRMLETVATPEFEAYVSKHGLWEDVHNDLVEKRSVLEVRFYLEHHNYLCESAAKKYVTVADHENRMFFLKTAYNGLWSTVETLIHLKPMDVEALKYAFFNYDYNRLDWSKKEEIELMEHANVQDVIEYVKNASHIGKKSWATLFFRDISLFEECLKINEKR